MPRRPEKPLLGFGPLGWALLPPALALAWVYFTGWDLRFHLMQLIYPRWSWETLVWFQVRLFYIAEGRWCPEFGPLVLLYLLPAMHLYPRRLGSWWYVFFPGWALARPLIEYDVAPFLRLGTSSMTITTVIALLAMFEAAALAIMTRSRLVAIGAGCAALWAVAAQGAVAAWAPTSNIDIYIAAAAWHLMLAVPLFIWAIRERVRITCPDNCASCGYDLRGSPGAICPECGEARTIRPA